MGILGSRKLGWKYVFLIPGLYIPQKAAASNESQGGTMYLIDNSQIELPYYQHSKVNTEKITE